MKRLILHLLLVFSIINCSSQQTFQVRKVPSTIANKYVSFKSLPSSNLPPVYIEKFLPKNFDQSGRKDYTAVIQKVINENSFVIFPDFPVRVNKNGLMIPSDKILYFQRNSKIIFAGPADTRESDILKVYRAKNVKIYNPKIIGSKFAKIPQTGEWSAGIAIYESEGVEVYNVNISETYGDGIIIGYDVKNVLVDGGWIDQARRDGISIISGTNINVRNLTISNTNGTLPMCGIQIEPNFPTDIFVNIDIRNIIGYNNKNTTLNFNIDPLNQQNLKVKQNAVSFVADNIEDYFSNYAVSFVLNPENKKHTPPGSIKITNVKSHSSKNFMWKDNGRSTVNLIADKMTDAAGKKIDVK